MKGLAGLTYLHEGRCMDQYVSLPGKGTKRLSMRLLQQLPLASTTPGTMLILPPPLTRTLSAEQ